MNRNQPTRSTMRRRWLCVAYAFPPINRSGTHRTLGFVRHLDSLGWDATVLTVDPGDEPVDAGLLDRVPESTEVIQSLWTDLIAQAKRMLCLGRSQERASDFPRDAARYDQTVISGTARDGKPGGVKEWVSRLLITPDSRLGWLGPATRRGMAAIRRRRPEVIYSTSPYMTAHLIAARLARRTGVPWVADFRDPWCDNPFRSLGFTSLRRWDEWLERRTLRRAAHVVCTTSTMRDRFAERLPFVREKSSVITNGFDAELLTGLTPTRVAPVEDLVLTHCGQFYGPRRPQVWFDALRRVLDQPSDRPRRIHLQLLGPDSYEGRPLMELAADAGVAEHVHVSGSKSHREALSHMAGSDVLLLAGSSGVGSDLQVPNKLFEYLAVRRPIIAAVSANSPVVGILREAGAEASVCDPEDALGIAEAIENLSESHSPDPAQAWDGVSRFDRANRARELAAIFQHVSQSKILGRTSRIAAADHKCQGVDTARGYAHG